MSTLLAITNAYDYFTPIEDAIAAVFEANNIKCYTPLGEQPTEGEADGTQPDKRHRPRVEICVHPGGNMGRLVPKAGVKAAGGNLRESMRRSTVSIRLVTTANIAQHRAFLCQVLWILDTICPAANNTRRLENHCIQGFRITGGSPGNQPQNGMIETELTAEMDFSTQTYAIEALEV